MLVFYLNLSYDGGFIDLSYDGGGAQSAPPIFICENNKKVIRLCTVLKKKNYDTRREKYKFLYLLKNFYTAV